MNSFPIQIRLLLLALTLQSSTPAIAEILARRIVGVSDGDTVTLLDTQKRQYKIRLSGIDAPEKKMPFGQRAKEHLSDLASINWSKSKPRSSTATVAHWARLSSTTATSIWR
jgi:endonuclease YncB( thermonuclease family)